MSYVIVKVKFLFADAIVWFVRRERPVNDGFDMGG